MLFFSLIFMSVVSPAFAKEIALTFDDIPFPSTLHFETNDRTDALLRKLDELKIPPVIAFANPCNRKNTASVLKQLGKYRAHGHLIGNHTCTHPKLDTVGLDVFAADADKADELLKPLMTEQKFFRFPFLNEGTDPEVRDKMRDWLRKQGYRNGMVSADNEDPVFSVRINVAKKLGKKINYAKVQRLFLDHILSSLDCDDELGKRVLGYSPRQVILLHERDATVMFIDSLVHELRRRGWKIISAVDAYADALYESAPTNTMAGFGIISQMAFEKTGERVVCYDYQSMSRKLNRVLGLTARDLGSLQ